MSTSQGTTLDSITLPAHLQVTLDGIVARNRARFGHDAFRMEDDDGDSDDAADKGDGSGDTGGGQGGNSDADKDADKDKADDNPWADPAKAKAEIERLRRENAADRTAAKTKAADDARNDLTQTLGKALGLIKDDDKTKVDPAELTRQLTDTQQQAKQTSIELAVYRAAGKHKGDPDALLDSRGFLAKLADLDPADATFQTKVDDAIKTAVDENPKLQTAPAAGSSSADHPGGSGGGGSKPKSLEEAIAGRMNT